MFTPLVLDENDWYGCQFAREAIELTSWEVWEGVGNTVPDAITIAALKTEGIL